MSRRIKSRVTPLLLVALALTSAGCAALWGESAEPEIAVRGELPPRMSVHHVGAYVDDGRLVVKGVVVGTGTSISPMMGSLRIALFGPDGSLIDQVIVDYDSGRYARGGRPRDDFLAVFETIPPPGSFVVIREYDGRRAPDADKP